MQKQNKLNEREEMKKEIERKKLWYLWMHLAEVMHPSMRMV